MNSFEGCLCTYNCSWLMKHVGKKNHSGNGLDKWVLFCKANVHKDTTKSKPVILETHHESRLKNVEAL